MHPYDLRERSTTRRQFGVATFLALPLLTLAACGDSTPPESSSAAGSEGSSAPVLAFSAIPDDNRSGLAERYELVARHLAEVLGVPVEYHPASSYGASVEAFKNGDLQLAWFGGVSGVQARLAVPGARAIAQGKVDPTFVSYFIAHAESGVEPSESFPVAMRGKTFTFGAKDSTSGRLMPEYWIRESTGESPEQFFGSLPQFSGSHDQTALQVQAGAVQCGALNYVTYDRMVADGKIDPAVCRKVWTTPAYPDYNWTAHPVLEERYGAGFTQRLADALVGITDPAVLAAMDRPDGLVPAGNQDYAAIEKTMRAIGMLR